MGGLASSPEIPSPDPHTGVGPSLHFFLPTPTLPSCQWKTQPPTLSRHQGLISTNELGNGNQMPDVDQHHWARGSGGVPPIPLLQATVGGNDIFQGGRVEHSRTVVLSSARYGGATRTEGFGPSHSSFSPLPEMRCPCHTRVPLPG